MQYTFRFRRRSYIASNDCSIFLLTPLIILILRKLFMREMFEFWVYVFSLGICLVCGWLAFWDGLYFAISKIYESRFNGSHRQRSYQLTFASNPPCSAFPNSTFMPCNLAIRWTIDSPSPLPVAVCPGGDRSVRQFAPEPLASHRGRYPSR